MKKQIILSSCLFSMTALGVITDELMMGMKPGVYIEHYNSSVSNNEFNKMASLNALAKINDQFKSPLTRIAFAPDEISKDLNELKILFDYKPKRHAYKTKFIGFAPYAMENDQGYYSGVGEVFNDSSLGACTYTVSDYVNGEMVIVLDKKRLSYKVNNKPTILNVEGEKGKAFMYTVSWADDKFEHTIECANKVNDPVLVQSLLTLAQDFDKQGVTR